MLDFDKMNYEYRLNIHFNDGTYKKVVTFSNSMYTDEMLDELFKNSSLGYKYFCDFKTKKPVAVHMVHVKYIEIF